MRRIFLVAGRRFLALGSDESGAALAVTIVMFSLLFLSFASVYAIGAATRDKIHLQNAADAAAYSAALPPSTRPCPGRMSSRQGGRWIISSTSGLSRR